MDNVQITAGGTISIYNDILLKGNSKLASKQCIETYNNSTITIDLTTRDKNDIEVLSYNCPNTPDLHFDLIGSYEDGCNPRAEQTQQSLTLLLDTPSCQDKEDTSMIPAIIISSIVAVVIVIVIVIVIFVTSKRKY